MFIFTRAINLFVPSPADANLLFDSLPGTTGLSPFLLPLITPPSMSNLSSFLAFPFLTFAVCFLPSVSFSSFNGWFAFSLSFVHLPSEA